jgi:hypothetical protein
MNKIFLIIAIIAISLGMGSTTVSADTTDSSVYGGGNYGDCNYGSCTITLTSNGSTSLNVLPDASGKCTINSDTASVLTDATSGYTLTLTTSTTDNALVGGSDSIDASSGTSSSPSTLAMNSWGYRVDNVGSFGAGPTSAQSNVPTPSLTFAGVPPSDQAAAVIASTTGPANPAEDTEVWYGICIDATIPADTYSTTVLYTAVVN